LQQKGVIYKKQEQEPDKYNFSSSLMQDLVRQKFEKILSDLEEREIVFELERFRTKITQKEASILKTIYRWFLNLLKEISKIILFNKSE
jgi:hypothetical protein